MAVPQPESWVKKGLRWSWYVLLFFIAAGAIEKGPAEAVGVLCVIVLWATFKLARGLTDLRAALERQRDSDHPVSR